MLVCIHLPLISDMRVDRCLWVFSSYVMGDCISDLSWAHDGAERRLEMRSSVPGLKTALIEEVYVGGGEK